MTRTPGLLRIVVAWPVGTYCWSGAPSVAVAAGVSLISNADGASDLPIVAGGRRIGDGVWFA